ncbi:hypothetical protein ACX9I7_16190 [Streptomyces sp. L500]
MRDRIVRALLWALRLLLPAHGRHSRSHIIASVPRPPTRPPYVICGGHRPIPPHHLTRHVMPPDTRPLIPRYLVEWERKQTDERRQQRERRRAVEAAWEGQDYPYTYAGSHFDALAVSA